MNMLGQRIAKLEAATSIGTAAPRIIRLICPQGQEQAARQLAEAEGWDAKSNDICIIRSIVAVGDQRQAPAPRVMSKSW